MGLFVISDHSFARAGAQHNKAWRSLYRERDASTASQQSGQQRSLATETVVLDCILQALHMQHGCDWLSLRAFVCSLLVQYRAGTGSATASLSSTRRFGWAQDHCCCMPRFMTRTVHPMRVPCLPCTPALSMASAAAHIHTRTYARLNAHTSVYSSCSWRLHLWLACSWLTPAPVILSCSLTRVQKHTCVHSPRSWRPHLRLAWGCCGGWPGWWCWPAHAKHTHIFAPAQTVFTQCWYCMGLT